MAPAKFAKDRNSVDALHVKVSKDKIEFLLVEPAERRLASESHLHLKTLTAKNLADGKGDIFLVVHHQQALTFHTFIRFDHLDLIATPATQFGTLCLD